MVQRIPLSAPGALGSKRGRVAREEEAPVGGDKGGEEERVEGNMKHQRVLNWTLIQDPELAHSGDMGERGECETRGMR